MAVQVGQPAPEFALKGAKGGEFVDVKLSDYRGKWVVLFFYPLDFTFVCPTEIQGFAKHNSEFEDLGAVVLGASTDSEHSHKAWIERDFGGALPFPLLSDMKGETADSYGVLLPAGIALRGTFIIDPEGTLKYAVVHSNNIGRNTDETLRVLQALQTGELCPVDWRPGQATLS